MNNLNDSTKNKIIDEIYELTERYTDDELDFAIEEMIFWRNERDLQNKEILEIERGNK